MPSTSITADRAYPQNRRPSPSRCVRLNLGVDLTWTVIVDVTSRLTSWRALVVPTLSVLAPIIVFSSGKLGSVVHSRNAHGPYTRPFVVPANPATVLQTRVRTRFRLISQQWAGTLTKAQRASWATYAAHVPVTTAAGRRNFLTGQQMFIRNNMPLPTPVAFTVRDAPVIFNHGAFTLPIVNKTVIPEEDRVRFNSGDAWTGETGSFLLIQTSDTFPESVNFFAGPWRFAGAVLGNDTVPPFNPTFVVDAWSPLPIAHKWARVRVARADGRLSSAFIVLFAPGFF